MDQSPFSKLSAELRNHVWALALEDDYAIDVIPTTTIDAITRFEEPGLTRVCRRIRNETQLMYYAVNTFAFYIKAGDASMFSKWLVTLGEVRRAAIGDLVLNVSTCCDGGPDYGWKVHKLLCSWGWSDVEMINNARHEGEEYCNQDEFRYILGPVDVDFDFDAEYK